MSTNRSKSRKKSPWDDLSDITVIQEYLQMHYVARYEQRHPKIKDSGEAELINSFQPNKCPFCETTDFIKIGFDANGIRRYKCKCGKTFKPTRMI